MRGTSGLYHMKEEIDIASGQALGQTHGSGPGITTTTEGWQMFNSRLLRGVFRDTCGCTQIIGMYIHSELRR